MKKKTLRPMLAIALAALWSQDIAIAVEPDNVIQQSVKRTPAPPLGDRR